MTLLPPPIFNKTMTTMTFNFFPHAHDSLNIYPILHFTPASYIKMKRNFSKSHIKSFIFFSCIFSLFISIINSFPKTPKRSTPPFSHHYTLHPLPSLSTSTWRGKTYQIYLNDRQYLRFQPSNGPLDTHDFVSSILKSLLDNFWSPHITINITTTVPESPQRRRLLLLRSPLSLPVLIALMVSQRIDIWMGIQNQQCHHRWRTSTPTKHCVLSTAKFFHPQS